MKQLLVLLIAACTVTASAQQAPLPLKQINEALKTYDKAVTAKTQYLSIDINDDGVRDIVLRDNDLPSAGYVVFLRKGNKIEMENIGIDGYDELGMAPGGYSVYQHDDHMGPTGRTLNTDITRYRKGKEVMTASRSLTMTYNNDSGEYDEDVYCSINGKAVSADVWNKTIPLITWFYDIKDGWRMAKNNQRYTFYPANEYNVFKGEIAGSSVTMCFNKDNTYAGFYYYDVRPEVLFSLECVEAKHSDNNNATITLKEYAPKGNNSGTFVGTISPSSFTGKFTNFKGNTYEFTLYER